jgi:hypothetical protein
MTQFQLFDAVNLTEAISLEEVGLAPEGTPGTIIEVLENGEAFMAELFGGWVRTDESGDFIPAAPAETTKASSLMMSASPGIPLAIASLIRVQFMDCSGDR